MELPDREASSPYIKQGPKPTQEEKESASRLFLAGKMEFEEYLVKMGHQVVDGYHFKEWLTDEIRKKQEEIGVRYEVLI